MRRRTEEGRFMAAAGTPDDQFWARVRKTDTCWEWTAALNDSGYGVLGRGGRVLRAHRISYEMHFGPFPKRLFVCHRCDNPRCVRPDHLFLGTQADNVRDMDAKGRGRRGGPAGEQASGAKLTETDVREIRRRAASGEPKRGIARSYAATRGVDRSSVADVIARRTWRHVQ